MQSVRIMWPSRRFFNRSSISAITVILLEVYAGVMKKSDALLLLQAMRATIEPAIKAIDDTIAKVKN